VPFHDRDVPEAKLDGEVSAVAAVDQLAGLGPEHDRVERVEAVALHRLAEAVAVVALQYREQRRVLVDAERA
jgi:hypothetical protein